MFEKIADPRNISFIHWMEDQTIPCGDCYRFAINLAKEMLDDGVIPEDGIKVCHGTVQEPEAIQPKTYQHAWVEAQGKVYDWQMKMASKGSLPQEDFYELFKLREVTRYSPYEAMTLMAKKRHYGPWN